MELRKYIKDSWNITTDKSGNIPYPFVPPCVGEGFTILYYWDTFFTNEGLIADGRVDAARNNVNNLIHFLYKLGCVPNCTHDEGAKWCSQPPFLYWMIERICEVDYDEEWAKKAYVALETEYEFWMKNRITPCGLNQHGTNETDENELAWYYDYCANHRLPLDKNAPISVKAEYARGLVAEAESGEDFTPRFKHKAKEFAPVDVNTHLYRLERSLANFYEAHDKEKSESYRLAAEKRAKKMLEFMQDEDGVLHDYNFVTGERSSVYAPACFLPYIAGLTDRGIEKILERVDLNCGVAACEDLGEPGYQWGYPCIWAPHQYFAVAALRKVGKIDLAKKIATEYTAHIRKVFKETGCLWEKYTPNGVAEGAEYPTWKMLGWTAGTYSYLYDFLTTVK